MKRLENVYHELKEKGVVNSIWEYRLLMLSVLGTDYGDNWMNISIADEEAEEIVQAMCLEKKIEEKNNKISEILKLFSNVNGAEKVRGVKMDKWQETEKVRGVKMDKWQETVNALLLGSESEEKEKFASLKLLQTDDFVIPNKMDLYEDLDITVKDKLFIKLESEKSLYPSVLFVNGEDHVIGIFHIVEYFEDGEENLYLVANSDEIDFKNHKSTKYFFIFADEVLKLYKVPIEVVYQKTEITNTHLCIDFGTSNTTAGCYLDDNYVSNISNIAKNNKNIVLNSENITSFVSLDKKKETDEHYTLEFNQMVPTIVYIEDCQGGSLDSVKYLFGYDAALRIKNDNYCPEASCFMEIKRWTSNIEKNEKVQDVNGNWLEIPRKEIIKAYLAFVIRSSENQFKCKFKKIHISAPVKMKGKVLDIYDELVQELGYELEKEHSIDEGVAVLYSIIEDQIKKNSYKNDVEQKALIIDCGGGTSDLASCTYKITKDEDDVIDLEITTEYMNGDVNFGGNNLTYRIMQYMKVVYANMVCNNDRIKIDTLIDRGTDVVFSYIEGDLEKDTNESVKERYENVYRRLNEEYEEAENVIPTRFSEYESESPEIYNKVKNNFYFLWELADEMKKEFYRSASISRYKFYRDDSNNDIDLHINRIEKWRLSAISYGKLQEQSEYPDVTFTAKEIDKLLRADIYYLVRKFLNDSYNDGSLQKYNRIQLSGQSSKIDIFMDSLKEFLPGKKIKSERVHYENSESKENAADERKLCCVKGAIMYLHALEKSDLEPELKNETQNIPITAYVKSANDDEKLLFSQGSNWEQRAKYKRITPAGKEIYIYMRSVDKEIGEPYIYSYENVKYSKTSIDQLENISAGLLGQEEVDSMKPGKKYVFVFLNKNKWGFDIMPLYKDENGSVFKGNVKFCSFEMDILQDTFFDGRK
jgi:hypothetical protein